MNVFRIGDLVEWTDKLGGKCTGTVIESSYDPTTIRTQYLIKLPTGQYIAKWDYELRRIGE